MYLIIIKKITEFVRDLRHYSLIQVYSFNYIYPIQVPRKVCFIYTHPFGYINMSWIKINNNNNKGKTEE